MKYCSEVVPQKACELLNTTLVSSNLTTTSQAYRLIDQYGSDPLLEEELCTPLQDEELLVNEKPDGQNTVQEVLYGMFDGGQFPYDDGYHEVKIGRIFRSSQIISGGQSVDNQSENHRNRVINSEYLMQEGHYKNFVAPYGELMDAQQTMYPQARLVFLTDGAEWMRKWVEQRYPDALHILDFYHAYEYLCDFAKHLIKNCAKREEKLQSWKAQLKNGEVMQIISDLETYRKHQEEKVRTEVEILLTYYQNNKHRMDYKTYLEKGYLIGSGAIESAVRNVAQQRCKLSGQRWNKGLQVVLNIRALYRSGKGKRIERIILNKFNNAA